MISECVNTTYKLFSELNMEFSGRAEYTFITIGEDVEVKLVADNFNKLPKADKFCSYNKTYSQIKCIEYCQWNEIISTVGCTGPWMPIDFPYCDNYNKLRELMSLYTQYL